MKYFVSLFVGCFLSVSAEATNVRLIDTWAYTKENKLIFLKKDGGIKEYEPLHCPVKDLQPILMSPTVDIRVEGTRLKARNRIVFKDDNERISCVFKSIT